MIELNPENLRNGCENSLSVPHNPLASPFRRGASLCGSRGKAVIPNCTPPVGRTEDANRPWKTERAAGAMCVPPVDFVHPDATRCYSVREAPHFGLCRSNENAVPNLDRSGYAARENAPIHSSARRTRETRMAVPNPKLVFKRDASGRTIIQRFEKIESAVRQGNADYRSSRMSEKILSREGKASEKHK